MKEFSFPFKQKITHFEGLLYRNKLCIYILILTYHFFEPDSCINSKQSVVIVLIPGKITQSEKFRKRSWHILETNLVLWCVSEKNSILLTCTHTHTHTITHSLPPTHTSAQAHRHTLSCKYTGLCVCDGAVIMLYSLWF